jgi:hypothetical protein
MGAGENQVSDGNRPTNARRGDGEAVLDYASTRPLPLRPLHESEPSWLRTLVSALFILMVGMVFQFVSPLIAQWWFPDFWPEIGWRGRRLCWMSITQGVVLWGLWRLAAAEPTGDQNPPARLNRYLTRGGSIAWCGLLPAVYSRDVLSPLSWNLVMLADYAGGLAASTGGFQILRELVRRSGRPRASLAVILLGMIQVCILLWSVAVDVFSLDSPFCPQPLIGDACFLWMVGELGWPPVFHMRLEDWLFTLGALSTTLTLFLIIWLKIVLFLSIRAATRRTPANS